jgi:hypothetical protein
MSSSIRWYSRLVPDSEGKARALFDHQKPKDGNLIVCQELDTRSFALFDNHLSFGVFLHNHVAESNRCFYELVPETASSKLYFDIDTYLTPGKPERPELTVESPEDADRAILEIKEQIKRLLPFWKERGRILISTSHSEIKRSYHLVLDGWSTKSREECKYFHDMVMNGLSARVRNFVDHSVYKKNQQFRIEGCHKWGSTRTKTLSLELSEGPGDVIGWKPPCKPTSERHRALMLLGATLLTNVADCSVLPSFKPPEPVKTIVVTPLEPGQELVMNDYIAHRALELVAIAAGMPLEHPAFPYDLSKWTEPEGDSCVIMLKRRMPSLCRICLRIHENENPYLTISGENRNVYFDCRRREDNVPMLYLGRLGRTAEEPYTPYGTTRLSTHVEETEEGSGGAAVSIPEPTAEVQELEPEVSQAVMAQRSIETIQERLRTSKVKVVVTPEARKEFQLGVAMELPEAPLIVAPPKSSRKELKKLQMQSIQLAAVASILTKP